MYIQSIEERKKVIDKGATSLEIEAYTNTEKNYLPRLYLPLFSGSEWTNGRRR